MTTTKVGIREFRAGLADYIDSGDPVAVTRYGYTVAYFIPATVDREAEAASLRAAAAKLDGLVDIDEADVDEMVQEFEKLGKRGGQGGAQ